jgi:cytochrome c
MSFLEKRLACRLRVRSTKPGHRTMTNLRSIGVSLIALFVAVACAQGPSYTTDRRIAASNEVQITRVVEDGRAIAESRCSSCHAVGLNGQSPNPAAPVFRTLLHRYRGHVLAQELIDGMSIAHAPMPVFQFDPKGADALIAYLESIQVTKSGPG